MGGERQRWSAGGISLQLSIHPVLLVLWMRGGLKEKSYIQGNSSWCHRNVHHLLQGNSPSLHTPCTGKDRPRNNRCDSSRQGILNPTLILNTQSFQDMSDSLFLFSPVHQIDLASFNNSRSFLESMCLSSWTLTFIPQFFIRAFCCKLTFQNICLACETQSSSLEAFYMYTEGLLSCLFHFWLPASLNMESK